VLRGLDLLRDVQTAYFDALAAQELVVDESGSHRRARRLRARRVAAARDPLMAGARAAGLAEAHRADGEAEAARARLASYWGGENSFALSLISHYRRASHAHALQPTKRRISPRRGRERLDAAAWASPLPNPTLSAGYRRFEDRNGVGAWLQDSQFRSAFSTGIKDRLREPSRAAARRI
jgi:hypothetical protein